MPKGTKYWSVQPCCRLNWIKTITIYQNTYWFMMRPLDLGNRPRKKMYPHRMAQIHEVVNHAIYRMWCLEQIQFTVRTGTENADIGRSLCCNIHEAWNELNYVCIRSILNLLLMKICVAQRRQKQSFAFMHKKYPISSSSAASVKVRST